MQTLQWKFLISPLLEPSGKECDDENVEENDASSEDEGEKGGSEGRENMRKG